MKLVVIVVILGICVLGSWFGSLFEYKSRKAPGTENK